MTRKRPTSEPLVYTVEEAGKLLGLGRTASYDAVRAGELPALRIRGKILVPRQALLDLLASASPTRPSTRPQ